MEYYSRYIDQQLLEWKNSKLHKPLLIRGARQVGKSSAIRHLSLEFDFFAEVNLEKNPELRSLFSATIDVHRLCQVLSATLQVPIVQGRTLLFIDEIQSCEPAIQSLRYFWEDMPDLHVVAAGSLLEFALEDISTFAVGRIRSIYLYPFSFAEYLSSQGYGAQLDIVTECVEKMHPIPNPIHQNLLYQLRTFYLIGGMPEAVRTWNTTHDFVACNHLHGDILDTYQQDFSKYKKRVNTDLLRQVFQSVAHQVGNKFVYAQVSRDIHSSTVREALHLLSLAGVAIPCTHTSATGLPLGAEANAQYTKYLFMDNGLMQNMLSLQAADVLLSDEIDFVNKGPFSEMFAGLELTKYHDSFQKSELYYWQNTKNGTQAEIDYLSVIGGKIIPIEVKASIQGGMQSLYAFMRLRHSAYGIRTSLENIATYTHDGLVVKVLPLYALFALNNCC